MELPTIDIPPAEAKKRFEEYRREVRRRHDAEDEAIAKGYKALTQGTPLIRLTEAMRLGGFTDLHLPSRHGSKTELFTVPKLAIARADARFAWTNGVHRTGALVIAGKREHRDSNRRDVVRFPSGSFTQTPGSANHWWGYELNSMVPIVPPPLRPSIDLGNFHILWEAEWKRAPGPPPGDPALLRHIGADLYAVHAVWDLTPLEQAVLAGRPFDA